METFKTLFRGAAYEEDTTLIIDRVAKAVRYVLSVLPFDRKNKILLEEPEIIRYLFFFHPILKNPVEITLNSIFEKFLKNPQFLSIVWKAFEYLADLKENARSTKDRKLKELREKLSEKYTFEFEEKEDTPAKRMNYCRSIEEKMVEIKLNALDYLGKLQDAMFETRTKESESFYSSYQVQMYELLKRIILRSCSCEVIQKTTDLLEMLRKYLKKSPWLEVSEEIEEVLLNKSKKPAVEDPVKQRRIHERTKTQIAKKLALRFSDMAAIKKVLEDNPPAGEPSHESTEFKGMASDVFEVWLCTDEIPLITKDETISEALKGSDNLDVLLTFLFEPNFFPLNQVWHKKYPHQPDHPEIPLSLIRSYKVMQVLTDHRNYGFISKNIKEFLEYFFNLLSISVSKDNVSCNLNHVMKVIEYCFKSEEQDLVISYILHYNLLFRFLKMLDFPLVSNFYSVIFGLSKELSPSKANKEKIFKYCLGTEFFQDLASAILNGESQLDPEKMKEGYKPKNVSELIDLSIGMKPKEDQSSELSDKSSEPDRRLLEEKTGFSVDIDRIKEVLAAKNKTRSRPSLKALNPNRLAKTPDDRIKNSTSLEQQKFISARSKIDEGNYHLNSAKKDSLQDYYGASNLAGDSKNSTVNQLVDVSSNKGPGSPLLYTRLKEFSPLYPKTKKLHALTPSNPNSTLHSIKDDLNKYHNNKLSSLLSFDSRKTESHFRPNTSLLNGSQLASPYLADETTDQVLFQEINDLYPSASRILIQSDIDREAKLPKFAPNYILNNDKISLELTELLFSMINQALELDHPVLQNLEESIKTNSNLFWRCFFESTKANVFEILLEVMNLPDLHLITLPLPLWKTELYVEDQSAGPC